MTRNKTFYGAFWALWMIPILLSPNCFAADPITWGAADGGLRLGLGTEPSRANGNLRVALDNVGSTDLSVLVAMKLGEGVCYLFQFSAVAADGRHLPIADWGPHSCPLSAGLVLPEVIRLTPGATREFAFTRRHLLYMSSGAETTLDSLLRQGYALSASLVVRQRNLDGAVMGGIPRPTTGRLWTGRLISSFHLLKSSY
jgi:hypothetical protein